MINLESMLNTLASHPLSLSLLVVVGLVWGPMVFSGYLVNTIFDRVEPNLQSITIELRTINKSLVHNSEILERLDDVSRR